MYLSCSAQEQLLKKLLNILDLQYGQYNTKVMNITLKDKTDVLFTYCKHGL